MIHIPSDVLAPHDDFYSAVTEYLKEIGELDPDEALKSVTIKATTDGTVTIESYSKTVIKA